MTLLVGFGLSAPTVSVAASVRVPAPLSSAQDRFAGVGEAEGLVRLRWGRSQPVNEVTVTVQVIRRSMKGIWKIFSR